MNLMKTRFWKTAAVLAGLAVLVMITPQAVRSTVAELVSVTNTVANPAITQPVPTMASQMVTLVPFGGVALSPNSSVMETSSFRVDGGLATTAYAVPVGQRLVITDIDVDCLAAGGTTIRLVWQDSSGVFIYGERFRSASAGTQQYRLASGIVYPPNQLVMVESETGGSGLAYVTLHGYLTAL